MVVIVCDVTRRVVHDLARCVRKGVPNGWTTAVFFDRAFDLIGGRCCSPDKASREIAQRVSRSRRTALRNSVRAERRQLGGGNESGCAREFYECPSVNLAAQWFTLHFSFSLPLKNF